MKKLLTLGEALEQLRFTQSKLNEQKIEMERMERAIVHWRNKAIGNNSILAIGSIANRAPLHERRGEDQLQRTKEDTLRGTCLRLADTLRPGKQYHLRVDETRIPADVLDPFGFYEVRITIWERTKNG